MSTPPFLVLPAGATAYALDTARGTYAVHDARPRTTAHGTALLVPGFTGSKEDFIAILGPLAEAGFRVVAYDQRGQYESAGPEPAEGWTTQAYAADLLAVAAALDAGPVHLLGHSFGGLVARAAVLTDPSAFCSLVLLGSGPAAFDDARADLLTQMAQGIEAIGLAGVRAITRAMDLENGWQPHPDPAVDAFLDHRFLSNDPTSLAAMARILVHEPDRTGELAACISGARGRLPTLIAFGEDDDAWSPKLQAETASRLGVPTVSFPKAAHSPAAEMPSETAAALAAFWDQPPVVGSLP